MSYPESKLKEHYTRAAKEEGIPLEDLLLRHIEARDDARKRRNAERRKASVIHILASIASQSHSTYPNRVERAVHIQLALDYATELAEAIEGWEVWE